MKKLIACAVTVLIMGAGAEAHVLSAPAGMAGAAAKAAPDLSEKVACGSRGWAGLSQEQRQMRFVAPLIALQKNGGRSVPNRRPPDLRPFGGSSRRNEHALLRSKGRHLALPWFDVRLPGQFDKRFKAGLPHI